jgi:hypothetical protein
VSGAPVAISRQGDATHDATDDATHDAIHDATDDATHHADRSRPCLPRIGRFHGEEPPFRSVHPVAVFAQVLGVAALSGCA